MTIDLSAEYLGLELGHPLVASASPCTGQPDVLRRLEACGAGAAVLPSLFEEQVMREDKKHPQADDLVGFPYMKDYNGGPENYVDLVKQARKAVSMPIIASLNGTTPSGCVEQARRIFDAGADALELNLHFVPVDPSISGQHVEAQYLDVVAAVSQRIQIPLVAKIGPYFSSLPYFARQVVEAGANGLVLFNRFMEPEIDLESQTIKSHLQLSHSAEARLSLRWLGILRDQLTCCSLASSGGIHEGGDALKAMAAGADVVMVTSTLLKHGAEYLKTLNAEMVEWLSHHDYTSIRQIIGSMSRERCSTPAVFERANYAQTLSSYLDDGVCSN
ncbi:MAG: dihydroorotate dehydrogenase-like protein [Planctomycetota bacterium]